MFEMQIDMIFLRPDAPALVDLNGHGAADNVARRQIFGRRRITLHKTLAFGVSEISTLAACTLGDQTAGAIDPCRVELHEFHILHWQTCTHHHAATVTGTGMGGGA